MVNVITQGLLKDVHGYSYTSFVRLLFIKWLPPVTANTLPICNEGSSHESNISLIFQCQTIKRYQHHRAGPFDINDVYLSNSSV